MEIKHRTDLNKLMGKAKLIGAEIGVAEGLNSRDMLTNWNMKTLYCVDNWATIEGQKGDGSEPQEWHDSNLENAKKLMKPFGIKAKFLVGHSVEMAKEVEKESLDFIYLDGDHSFDGVLADLKAWAPKVKKGGVIAGHDYLNFSYGVNQAVNLFAKGKKVHTVPEHIDINASFYFIK